MRDRLILAFRKDDWVSLGLAKVMIEGSGIIRVPPIYTFLGYRAVIENVGPGYIFLYMPDDVDWPKLEALKSRALKIIEFSVEGDSSNRITSVTLPISNGMLYTATEWSHLPYLYLGDLEKETFILIEGVSPQEAIIVGNALRGLAWDLYEIESSIERLYLGRYIADPVLTPNQIIEDFIFSRLNILLANYKRIAVRSAIIELFKKYSLEQYVPLQSLIEFSYNRLQAFNYSSNLLKLLEKENISYGDL
jgi:hypothetical protein